MEEEVLYSIVGTSVNSVLAFLTGEDTDMSSSDSVTETAGRAW